MDIYVREDTAEMCEELDRLMIPEGYSSTPEYNAHIKQMAFVLYAAVKLKDEK